METNLKEKHELIYKILLILGMDPEKAEQNASEMEHKISDDVYKMLKHHMFNVEKILNVQK